MMTIGGLAIGLIIVIGMSGLLGMGFLRARNARDRGQLNEAKTRIVFITSLAGGFVLMMIAIVSQIPTIGMIGVAVIVVGGVDFVFGTLKRD